MQGMSPADLGPSIASTLEFTAGRGGEQEERKAA